MVKSEWVEELDISKPIDNFDELLPDPAYKWEFELDTFQKQVNNYALLIIAYKPQIVCVLLLVKTLCLDV